METKFDFNISDINKEEMLAINGGGFAYDLGFFLREIVVYAFNGQSGTGVSAVGTDLVINYKPLN